jgi:hypothetical protein
MPLTDIEIRAAKIASAMERYRASGERGEDRQRQKSPPVHATPPATATARQGRKSSMRNFFMIISAQR